MLAELAPIGQEAELAWNPEFLREGFAMQDTLHPDRIVLGVDPQRQGRAEAVAREVYSTIIAEGSPFVVTDRGKPRNLSKRLLMLSSPQGFFYQCDGRSL